MADDEPKHRAVNTNSGLWQESYTDRALREQRKQHRSLQSEANKNGVEPAFISSWLDKVASQGGAQGLTSVRNALTHYSASEQDSDRKPRDREGRLRALMHGVMGGDQAIDEFIQTGKQPPEGTPIFNMFRLAGAVNTAIESGGIKSPNGPESPIAYLDRQVAYLQQKQKLPNSSASTAVIDNEG
jgi:hypothetical protein